MINQAIIVGRMVDNIEKHETEEGKTISYITLAVQRTFKNIDGVYETDFIPCVLWEGIAKNAAEYCQKGDVVGVKGRLQSDKNGVVSIIAEKITFLSSKKNDEVENGKEGTNEA